MAPKQAMICSRMANRKPTRGGHSAAVSSELSLVEELAIDQSGDRGAMERRGGIASAGCRRAPGLRAQA